MGFLCKKKKNKKLKKTNEITWHVILAVDVVSYIIIKF